MEILIALMELRILYLGVFNVSVKIVYFPQNQKKIPERFH